VTLQATASSDRGIDHVTFQSAPAGTTTWTDACTATAAPYSCDFDTAGVADGSRDLRAVAVDQAGYQRTAGVSARVVDNTAPTTATLTDPGTPMTATETLSGGATDAGSGIASWTVQYKPSAGSTWTAACSDTASPFGSCAWLTTAVADGLYDLRAVATDAAGNQRISATVASRRVDNTAPAVTLTNPGATLTGTVSLAATATDAGGVASVAFERSPAGVGTWVSICTDSATPFSCSFNTAALADGSYDLRARATDAAGNQSTSVVSGVRLENSSPAGSDVQAGNGGATAGLLEAGDWIRLTWSEPLAPASILSGWTGAAQAIRVTVTNSASNDRMDFTTTGGTRLNLVNTSTDLQLNANVGSATTTFNATMLQSGSSITVTLGSKISGTTVAASSGTMTWRPSGSAKDLSGKAVSTATVTESGAADKDF
jgi:hypothetical protein